MVPAALLEDLIVLLMVHVRRPSDRQHPRVAFANEFSISMPLDVVSRINEPHLSGQHLGCDPRQTRRRDAGNRRSFCSGLEASAGNPLERTILTAGPNMGMVRTHVSVVIDTIGSMGVAQGMSNSLQWFVIEPGRRWVTQKSRFSCKH